MWSLSSIGNLEFKGMVAASLLGGLVGLPWLFSYSYSLGHDLPLWIYNGWYTKETLLNGVVPNWSYMSASGQPFFKMSGLVDGVLSALFMEVFGVFKGIQVFMWGLYVLAAVGFYKMFHFLRPCRISALTASGVYILSWFITFTANFQVYIGNFFIYALLPFFVLCAFRLIKKFTVKVFLFSAAILACAILSNPQVAIKMALIALLAITPLVPRNKTIVVFGVAVGIGLVAILLTMFDLVSALRLREEVVTLNDRSNGYTSPFSLIAIPAYALSLFVDFFIGMSWPEVSLYELLYSTYPGLVVVILSIIALYVQGSKRRMIRSVWAVILVTYGIFFLIMPNIPASPWLGTSHNLLIIPSFFLSLLAGFGIGGIVDSCNIGEKRKNLIAFSVISLCFFELCVLSIGLRVWGTVRTTPDDLPQVDTWLDLVPLIERGNGQRFLSLYPNHSTNLFPVVTGLPTANVIELRQRLPEYKSYLDLIKRCSKNGNCPQPISHLLAPLNVGLIDVPSMFFSYRGPGRAFIDSFYYEDLLHRVFDADPNLNRVITRAESGDDLRLRPNSTDWSPWRIAPNVENVEEVGGRLAQVVYQNSVLLPAYVAEGAIAIVGPGLEPEKKFEEVVLLPEYQPGRFVFILTESLSDLNVNVIKSIKGALVLNNEGTLFPDSPMNMEDVRSLYTKPTSPVPTVVNLAQGAENVTIQLDAPVEQAYFLVVSQQYFTDWAARNDQGKSLALFKVGGGLTGSFIQKGTQVVEMFYQLPTLERIGRWVSLSVLVGWVIAIISVKATKLDSKKTGT